MARTLRAAPSCCGFPSAFCPALMRLAIKRLQRTAVPASKLARPSAADPQPVKCNDYHKGAKMSGKKTIIHILFGFCLFSFGLNQAVSSENNIANYYETISVLKELYKAEITASKTYSGFARKALEEGYYSVARLFSALSESESVHARNFKNILNDLGVETENVSEPDIKISDTKKKSRMGS